MNLRILTIGIALWIVGTVAIRLSGQHLLAPARPVRVVVLYIVSFLAMALLARRIFKRLKLEQSSWPGAATVLALPTLILDPFSCLLSSTVFPNLDSAAVGIFGGWMLICCGGAVAGAWLKA